MLMESLVGLAIPLAIGGVIKAIQVDGKVKDQEADIAYIRGRIDYIIDRLIDKRN